MSEGRKVLVDLTPIRHLFGTHLTRLLVFEAKSTKHRSPKKPAPAPAEEKQQ